MGTEEKLVRKTSFWRIVVQKGSGELELRAQPVGPAVQALEVFDWINRINADRCGSYNGDIKEIL